MRFTSPTDGLPPPATRAAESCSRPESSFIKLNAKHRMPPHLEPTLGSVIRWETWAASKFTAAEMCRSASQSALQEQCRETCRAKHNSIRCTVPTRSNHLSEVGKALANLPQLLHWLIVWLIRRSRSSCHWVRDTSIAMTVRAEELETGHGPARPFSGSPHQPSPQHCHDVLGWGRRACFAHSTQQPQCFSTF